MMIDYGVHMSFTVYEDTRPQPCKCLLCLVVCVKSIQLWWWMFNVLPYRAVRQQYSAYLVMASLYYARSIR